MNKPKRDNSMTLGSALGALAERECRTLQRALGMRKRRQEGIHQARKSCRRLRSLLGLLPPDQPADALDHALKDLARGLSPLRDAHIAAHTAQLLATAHATWVTPSIVQAFEQRSEHILEHALKDDPHWRGRRAEVQRISAALRALSWQEVVSGVAKDALRRSKRRVKKARRVAQAQRTPSALHRWRRRARKLRYQLDFLRKARRMAGMKKRYGKRIKQLTAVTDQLGWRQDFRIFMDALDTLPDSPEVVALRKELWWKSARWSKSAPAS